MSKAVEDNAHDARPPAAPDWQQIAAGIEQMRETVRAIVAALIADGFTDREARAMTAAMFTNHRPQP